LKGLNLDLFTIALIVAGILSVIAIIMIPADAITREDIDNLQERQAELRERDLEIDVLLDESREERSDLENRLEICRDDLKQLKRESNMSWDAFSEMDDKKIEILDLESAIRDNIDGYLGMLDEKNDIFKEIRLLDFDVRDANVKVKAANFNVTDIRKAIGIKLSNNCIVAITNNITTTCPTYEELSQLDSSDHTVSGNFTDEGGYFHRDVSPMQNSWRWYDHDDTPRIFVDPPAGMSERIPTITIENNFGIYLIAGDHLLENGTRSHHEKRFIDNCRTATLDSEGWMKSLPATLWLMRIGCPDTENLDIVYTYHNATEINIAESNDWKYKAWLADTKEACKTICKEY
jgi:hypothetical protein